VIIGALVRMMALGASGSSAAGEIVASAITTSAPSRIDFNSVLPVNATGATRMRAVWFL
jgi:hypothetical protein